MKEMFAQMPQFACFSAYNKPRLCRHMLVKRVSVCQESFYASTGLESMNEVLENSKKLRLSKYIFTFLKVVTYIACYFVFAVSLITILIKFNQGVTSTSTEVVIHDKLKFPIITICPSIAFKSQGYFYREEDFIAQTFSKEELFAEETILDFANTSQYIYKETRSELLGLCHTLEFLHELDVQDWTLKPIKVKRHQDLKVFVHDTDEEFWLWRAIFPVSLETVELKVNSSQNDVIADLLLRKSEFHYISRGEGCLYYEPNYSFTKCAIEKLPKFLRENGIQCMTATQNAIMKEQFPFCTFENETVIQKYIKNSARVVRKFVNEVNKLGCPRTCVSTLYSPTVNTFNQGQDQRKDVFAIHPYYVTTSVEIKKEFFVYDAITLLTSLGGTLGLLLGYSALSMILFCLDRIEKCISF